MSSTAVEDVLALGHVVWLQMYIFKDREISESLLQRAESAGCQAVVWTVDVPILGLRENLIRARFRSPDDIPLPNLFPYGSPPKMAIDLVESIHSNYDPGLTWEDLKWLRSNTKLPIWIKGVLRDDDAHRAADEGVDGLIVSNHGGRQLDTAVPAITALEEVSKAVSDRLPILMDGGIRRGSDIFKALALGADAVLLGRAPLWGLAVDGKQGVSHVF